MAHAVEIPSCARQGPVYPAQAIPGLLMSCRCRAPEPRLNIKTVFPMYGGSHVKDNMVARPSYLFHGDPYIGKTTSLYWDGLLGISRHFIELVLRPKHKMLIYTHHIDLMMRRTASHCRQLLWSSHHIYCNDQLLSVQLLYTNEHLLFPQYCHFMNDQNNQFFFCS